MRYTLEQNAVSIHEPLTPRPWINYLGNRRLKAFISQNAGGLLWHHEPYSQRLSRYHYTAAPGDRPGFYLYLRDGRDGRVWNPHFAPSCQPLDHFECQHRPGRTRFEASLGGLMATVDYGIPPHDDVMLWQLRIENRNPEAVTVEVASYMEFGLLEFMREAIGWCYLQSHFSLDFDAKQQAIRYDYHVFEAPFTPCMLFASTEPVQGYDASREAFIGRTGTLALPEALQPNHWLTNSTLPGGGHGCGTLGHRITLQPGETAGRNYLFALGERWDEAESLLDRYRKTNAFPSAFAAIDDFWKERLSRFQVEGLNGNANHFANTWNPYNALVALEHCRIISTDHMGTDGHRYRDTTQDALAVAHFDPEYARTWQLAVLAQQARDGSGVFSFFPGTPRQPGLAPHRSDNTVWPVWTVQALIAETGDWSLLDTVVPFGDGGEATVYEHLCLGLRWIANHCGPHGLPMMAHADWNDGLALFGDEKAESVMLGMQLVAACRDLATMARHRQDKATQTWCNQQVDILSTILNSDLVWDGHWYRRLILSDGRPVGSHLNSQGRIFLEPQVWSVMSGVGDHDNRGRKAMDAVAEQLATDAGLMILAPAFRGFPEPDDPPRGSSPGSNENGAVFCHANTWAIIAEAMLGRPDKAWSYYERLLPTRLIARYGAEHYQREPYAYVSSIAGADSPLHGRGGISWLTGTASWMYIALTQYLLGLRPTPEGLRIYPCLRSEDPPVTVIRTFRGKKHTLVMEPGKSKLTVDGQPCTPGSVLPL